MKHENINCAPSTYEELALQEDVNVTQQLVNKVQAEASTRLLDRARRNRREALMTVTRFAVVVSTDGVSTQQIEFERPPTLADIENAVGPDAFLVSYGKALVERQQLAATHLAAE